MIRPASEIEYPPSEALCTKARMIARMERLTGSVDGLMKVISQRVTADEEAFLDEIQDLTNEQERLLDNMRRILQS